MNKLYIVGKVTNDYDSNCKVVREFIGVYDEEGLAILACKTNKYFYHFVWLNQDNSDLHKPQYIYPK